MELKKLSVSWYWILKIGYRIFHFMCHCLVGILFWGKGKVVPPIKNPLLLKSATKLAEEIREGKLKSEEVVRSYIARILEVEPYIHAVAESRYADAILEAKEVDALVASGKYTKCQLEDEKPLLGVPFTCKVLLTVKGMHSTAASMLFKDVIAAEDSPSVTLLKNAGGIVLAISNSAEMGLGFDTINPLYGRTCNPYDSNRSAGGSSGGESALLGAAGSVIGLGNDLTGSVRVPAHFTGVFAHKASLGMVPSTGSFPAPNPSISKFLFTGPMCRYSEDLVTMMKVLTSKNEKRIKFGQPVNFKNLKIYYQMDLMDPIVHPLDKEIRQAMKRAISYFKDKYGVVAEEVNVKLLNFANGINFHVLVGDVHNIVQQATSGKVNHLNGFLELLKFLVGKSKYSLWAIVEMGFGKYPVFFTEGDVPMYRELLQKLGDKFDNLLDEDSVFFYPTLPIPAPRHYEMIPLVFSTMYTGVFNFLGLPATQCPLGLNRNGMPHGMQIVGRKNNDPLTLACADELSKVFGGWIPPNRKR